MAKVCLIDFQQFNVLVRLRTSKCYLHLQTGLTDKILSSSLFYYAAAWTDMVLSINPLTICLGEPIDHNRQ